MKTIEILIALILVYAILSIIVSILLEWWNSKKKTRGKMLRQAIFQMLDDPLNLNYGYLLINHPLVSSMKNKAEDRPFQYLDSGIFADALIDIIGDQADKGIPVNLSAKAAKKKSKSIELSAIESFGQGLQQMNSSPFQKMLLSLNSKSKGNYAKLKKSIEEWYDSNMERATGWYKRKQKKSLVFFGFLVAILLNVDSIHLFKVISMNDNLRNNLVTVAEGVAEKYETMEPEKKQDIDEQIGLISSSLKSIDSLSVDSNTLYLLQEGRYSMNNLAKQLKLSDSVSEANLKKANEIMNISAQLGLPLGWSSEIAPISWFAHKDSTAVLSANKNKLVKYMHNRNNLDQDNWYIIPFWIIGIIITAFMLSFGATFWFDLLVKFVNIRKAGLKPASKTQIK